MLVEELSLKDRILLFLHNLGAVKPLRAKEPRDLAKMLNLREEEVSKILNDHESQGYAKSYVDEGGLKRYYLSTIGIIRACSIFS
jgi:DNA-binding MarR family transcriptional regulator